MSNAYLQQNINSLILIQIVASIINWRKF